MLRLTLVAAVLGATFATAASAVGPAPGEALALRAGPLRYVVAPSGGSTLVRVASLRNPDLRRSVRIAGAWGIPRVAFDGTAGGLSFDRKTLVLAQRTHGALARPTRFALLDPATLALRRVVSIPGRFAFDALSPDGARLYLIEYVSVVGELRYRVRGYDLQAGRLERGVIADKRSGWTAMQGQPLARATSADGAWAYTLYGNATRPFVHALNTAQGYAVCVNLPIAPAAASGSTLRLDGARLAVMTRGGRVGAVIDTRSLQVVG